METALIKYSLGEKISGVHNFKTATASEQKRPSGACLANELSEVMAELEKDDELRQCKLKAMVQSDKGLPRDLRALSLKKDSNQIEQKSRGDCTTEKLCRGYSKGKEVLQANEVEKLSERLKILEEENEYMKQALLNTLSERRLLLDEIYQQFQEMHHCFHCRNKLTGDSSCDGSSVVIPREVMHFDMINSGFFNCEQKLKTAYSERERTYAKGLSQILSQESSSSVVTRHKKKKNIPGPEMTLWDIP